MGCCNSQPMTEREDLGPAPVKAPATATPAPAPAAVSVGTPAAAAAANTTAPTAAAAKTHDAHAVDGTKPIAPVQSQLKGQQRYEISPGVLGKGHFAVVKKCRDVVTGATYAVKVIEKKEMVKSSASVVKSEIEILKAVGSHPNIVQLIDHFEDATRHYLVMELCMGGDLFSQIVEHGKYSELQAVRSCKQLASALKHIHGCGITHRDLKPENILLTSPSPESPLKLADFGLSKLIKGHLHPMRTVCGTWAYCLAPETLLRCVDQSTGKMHAIRAEKVNTATQLIDEHYRPVGVKAIHTTAASRAQLWSVHDARTGALLFRCTPDHKLSLVTRDTNERVEIRTAEFAEMSHLQQQRYQGYTASPVATSPLHTTSPNLPSHIGRTFSLRLTPPAVDAPLERYIGIEVASAMHRFMLDSEVVTSNCAPEVIQRKPYDSSVDQWTLGVLMYILLSGYHPFDVFGESPEPELLQKIITCSYDFDDPVWEAISQNAKDLIKGLLVLDPTRRMTLETYLASSWINGGESTSTANNELVVERLSKFGVGRSKLRTLVVLKMASNKFKASLSRKQAREAAAAAAASGNGSSGTSTPLLSDGQPDYLGLGSLSGNGGGAGTSVKLPLESVRERGESKAASSTLLAASSGTGSHSNNGGARHGAPALSVTHIDPSMLGSNHGARTDRGSSLDGFDDHSMGTPPTGPRIHEQTPIATPNHTL